jgi:hypothetical protein
VPITLVGGGGGDMARKAKGKRRLWSDIIENVEPTSGYIPFSQAAFWLATKGGTSRFDLEDSGTWKLAYDQLLKRIESGEVEAIGRRRGHGTNEIISGHTFSKIKIAYPCRDTPDELLFGTFPYIQCYGPVDDDHWQRADGFDDKLFATGHTVPEWTHLQVKASDLARYWPFQDATANTNTSTRAGESVPLKRPHKRGGCKPTWDQEEGIQFLCEEFDKRGHFDDTGQTSCWDRQRYAEDALIAHLSKHSQSDGPSRSWARRTVKLAETRWRQAARTGDTP